MASQSRRTRRPALYVKKASFFGDFWAQCKEDEEEAEQNAKLRGSFQALMLRPGTPTEEL